MQKRTVKSGNKTYIITVPTWGDYGGGGTLAGSLDFGANADQYLSIAGGTNFVLGTGSFTVEWFQYHKSLTSFARVYTQVVWPDAENAVSVEGTTANGTGYLWLDGLGNTPAVANAFTIFAPRLNQWDHFAITRQSGSNIQMFRNGTRLGFITRAGTPTYVDANISSSAPLFIGSEGDGVVGTRFSGSITNFRIVKGYALYSESYSRPTSPLTAVAGTVLLLLAESDSTKYTDSSGVGNTVTGNSVSWSVNSPFA